MSDADDDVIQMLNELIKPGEMVRIDAIPLEALSEEFRLEFLMSCVDGGYPSGDAVIIGYRGQDTDGTHRLWAVPAP